MSAVQNILPVQQIFLLSPTSVCPETFQNFCYVMQSKFNSLLKKAFADGRNLLVLSYGILFTFPKWYKQLKVTEVVSTSNLVSSETEKTTTVCNFQTVNSSVLS